MPGDGALLRLPLFCVLLLSSTSVHAEKGLQLVAAPNFMSYEDLQSIKFVTEDAWYTGQSVSYDNQAIWLNPDPREAETRAASNVGKIICREAVRFKYPGHGVISFETSFTFQIITTNSFPNCGSGMTFFIADYFKAPQRSYGRYFGLVSPLRTNSYRFFAVEFDTHKTDEFADPSASHIGIDINSLKSVQYVDSQPNSSSPFYPDLFLYNNSTFTVWIKYNSQAKLIEVWMSQSSSSLPPPSPCLSLRKNLSDVFLDYMYVGFSASSNASEDGMEGHALYAWNFTIYPPDSSKSKARKLLFPMVSALSAAVLLCVCSFFLNRILGAGRKKEREVPVHDQQQSLRMPSSSRSYVEELSRHSALEEYSYDELILASQNFSDENEIGNGAFSVVYKATLEDGKMIAIKRLREGSRKELEFFAEIRIISSVRHRNLLSLRGWCYEKGEALLVYDYMKRGSLNRYLYGVDRGTLSSKVRLDILVGVASALEYLHEHLGDCVLHRDVKPENILLTEEWIPVLGDFGLARLIRHTEHSVAMTAAGSLGYIAPEVVLSSKVTHKADVYSFGVLSLAVASGRRAMPESMSWGPELEEMQLVDWMGILYERRRLAEGLDPAMIKGMPDAEKDEWMRVLQVALECVHKNPKWRPTMRQARQALHGDDVGWMRPSALTARRLHFGRRCATTLPEKWLKAPPSSLDSNRRTPMPASATSAQVEFCPRRWCQNLSLPRST